MKRKLIIFILVIAFILSLSINAEMKTIMDYRTETSLSEGLKHISITRETTEGPLDINILKIDLNNQYTDLKPIYSSEISVKKPLSVIAQEWHSTAAINGEFYSINNPSFPFGTLIDLGRVISAPNSYQFGYPTIVKGSEGFDISVLEPRMKLLVNGLEVRLHTINKVGALDNEVIMLNSSWGKQSLGSTVNKELVEILVYRDRIRSIHIGEKPIDIPDDGFVIVFNSKNKEIIDIFQEGTFIETVIDLGFDINNIDWAAGGVNHLVKDGQVFQYNDSILGRHPRTAIGINKEEDTAFLVTVDGRNSHSIGTLQSELASILVELGCWNALNLDGGGSTQMVVDFYGIGEYTVVNNPSDGRERQMVSGFGVFNRYPANAEVMNLEIIPKTTVLFKNQVFEYDLRAYNNYNVPIRFEAGRAKVTMTGLAIRKSSEGIIFTESGKATLKVYYNGVSSEIDIEVLNDVEELVSDFKEITLQTSEQYKLPDFKGIDNNGKTAIIKAKEIEWEVSNSIGNVTSGVFLAGMNAGKGILTGRFDRGEINIPVYVGYDEKLIHDFESLGGLLLNQYPSDSNGRMIIFERSIEGRNSIKLFYDFTTMKPNDQAIAFVEFGETGSLLQGEPKSFTMWVFGDRSNHWLRARIVDANGILYRIDFAEEIDWYGWKQVTAGIPNNVVFPVALKNIYIANIYNDRTNKGSIYIDKLTANYPLKKMDTSLVPANTQVSDSIKGKPSIFDDKITINIEGVFINSTPIGNNILDDMHIVEIDVSKGGIKRTDSNQWSSLVALKEISNDTIIIRFNSHFNDLDPIEAGVLRNLFHYLRENNNNKVFVVSSGVGESGIAYDKGVRYIHFMHYFELYKSRDALSYYYE
ncbi:MAG: Exopolysaccharide biosynthesis protein [Clostridiales bacterium 38_11]|nr:MAG: Exopolysaccharide biosynthesis protein [Clostridiales bacterium 38_11]